MMVLRWAKRADLFGAVTALLGFGLAAILRATGVLFGELSYVAIAGFFMIWAIDCSLFLRAYPLLGALGESNWVNAASVAGAATAVGVWAGFPQVTGPIAALGGLMVGLLVVLCVVMARARHVTTKEGRRLT